MYLKPDIALNYTYKIWNMTTIGSYLLLLELRDEDTLSVYYDLYNILTQEYLWQNFTLDDSWRTGISYASERAIIFHKFKQGTVPEVEKIVACDVFTGSHLWEVLDVQPLEYNFDVIKVLKNGQPIFLSMVDGREVEGHNSLKASSEIMKQPKIPLTYSEGSDNFDAVKAFVKQKFQELPVGKAQYLEYNKNIFLAYHVNKDEEFEVKIVALSNDGNIWLDHKVEISDKIASDIFFIWSGYLFFNKGQHSLYAFYMKEE